MEVLILVLFICFLLASSGVAFFVWNHNQKNHEFAARLSLLPLDQNETSKQVEKNE